MAHWSHAFACALGTACAAAGANVTWFAPMRRGQVLPAPPAGVAQLGTSARRAPPLHRVDVACEDTELEAAVARWLRERPAARVVHVGAGARGSPNFGWLAERMGSPAFAVVRADEVLCHRGDLRERDGAVCADPWQLARCRTCCAASWWRTPPADALANRADLLVGSFAVADAVFAASAADGELLQRFGVPGPRIVVGHDVGAIAARVLAARAGSLLRS